MLYLGFYSYLFFFGSLWGALLLPLESTGKRGNGLTSSSYQHNLYLAAPQSVCVSIHFIISIVLIFLNKAPLKGRPSTVVGQKKNFNYVSFIVIVIVIVSVARLKVHSVNHATVNNGTT